MELDIVNDVIQENGPDIVFRKEHGLLEPKIPKTLITGYTLIKYFCKEWHNKDEVQSMSENTLKT